MTRDELVNSVKMVIAAIKESKSEVRGVSLNESSEHIMSFKVGGAAFWHTPEQFADLLLPPPPWRDKTLAELPPGAYQRDLGGYRLMVTVDEHCCITGVRLVRSDGFATITELKQEDLTATDWQPYEGGAE